MLRAVSTICVESRVLELLIARRADAFPGFRRGLHAAAPLAAAAQTVLTGGGGAGAPPPAPHAAAAAVGCGAPPPPPPPPPQPPRWPAAALAAALTASLGGVYFYRKLSDESGPTPVPPPVVIESTEEEEEPPYPASGDDFPAHVQYLVVGAGTAAFAAMRAIRAARPDARVLLVGEERALPYMRPPLSKELWREPDLAERAARPDDLTFRQWNGRRRPVQYEPAAFYTPVGELSQREHGGAAVARGWRVTQLDVAEHTARLEAPGRPAVTVRYDKCLVATGVRARRVPALREAAAAGRALALRGLRDAARLAAALDRPHVQTVAVLGGGFLATELSAALAERLGAGRVVQVLEEEAPMAGVLPPYLAADLARRLSAAGVRLVAGRELAAAALRPGGAVRLELRREGGAPEALDADLVVECVGAEVDPSLAEASSLETHPSLGGLLVNAELQARADVWAAGDAACFYDVSLGRRRVEHHDHAVVSGRLAGQNMAALAPPAHYTHQSMFWSDLGPQLGYEAIGIIDSRLPTVGVFSADAVTEAETEQTLTQTEVGAGAAEGGVLTVQRPGAGAVEQGAAVEGAAAGAGAEGASSKRYSRGVVFYLRDQRVVGVLLWNLFNRMHIARQVLAHGEFDDLFEVGKLFSPHEED